MDFLQILILAIVQGVTEFLPISSSAHLQLPALLLGWTDQGLGFDIAVHVGTLLAVVFYFRSDLQNIGRSAIAYSLGKGKDSNLALGMCLLVGTLPIVLLGLPLKPIAEEQFRDLAVVAWTTLGFGILLGIADWAGSRRSEARPVTVGVALWIGLAQVLALMPGTSRSGIVITMALFLGVARTEAARFAMLLSIPVIIAAGSASGLDAVREGLQLDWTWVATATGVSAITAFGCIAAFIGFVERVGMFPFVAYRVALGLVLLWLI